MTMTRSVASRRWAVPLGIAAALLLGGLALPTPAVHAAGPLHVTSCADDGSAATLRGRMGAAANGDTIVFDQDCTITLTGGTLSPTHNMTIDGTGHTAIVDGGCSFSGGACTSGGVVVFAVNGGVTATLNHLTIQHGNAVNAIGGGIYNLGTLTVTNSTITGNSAKLGGGGIENAGTMTVIGSTIAGNSLSFSTSGGGISNGTGRTLTVTNSTISGNTATFGGGIDSDGPLTVTNSTITGNRAPSGGGGIYSSPNGTTTLTNTIVANSTSGGDLSGLSVTGTHNLIDNPGSAGGLTDGASGNIVGHAAGLAAAIADNGGPTQTFALLTGSLAIAHGDPTVCASTTVPAAAPVAGKDQRGVTRPAAVCAIGAVEPLLSRINRSVGPTTGGTAVTLTGAGFAAGATVSIGGASCTNALVSNSTTLTCTTGAHAAGVVDVVVTVGGKTGTLTGGFTYGDASSLPPHAPNGPAVSPANPLPGRRSVGSPVGVPNPVPISRP